MLIRNNSDKEWLNYNCGGIFVDIKANSEFEVEEPIGKFLLRVLGHKNWLVKVDEFKTKAVSFKAPAIDEILEVSQEIDLEIKETIEEVTEKDIEPEREKEKKAIICAFCGGKNYRHKKDCTRNNK